MLNLSKIELRDHLPDGTVREKLKFYYAQYIRHYGVEPTTIYASSAFGNIYPLSICSFAIKYKLKIKFIDKPSFGKVFFYFSTETVDKEVDIVAYWIPDTVRCYCSNCGEYSDTELEYCPNCHAYMGMTKK